jgi:hypothetical protein
MCPHCDKFHGLVPIGPAPCYSVEECGACGETFYLYHSRLDPKSFREKPDDFGPLAPNPARDN